MSIDGKAIPAAIEEAKKFIIASNVDLPTIVLRIIKAYESAKASEHHGRGHAVEVCVGDPVQLQHNPKPEQASPATQQPDDCRGAFEKWLDEHSTYKDGENDCWEMFQEVWAIAWAHGYKEAKAIHDRMFEGHVYITNQEYIELCNNKRESSSPILSANWQPIETAPKDGTYIMVASSAVDDGHIQCAYWEDAVVYCWCADDSSTRWHKDMFTHWMPLPKPPTQLK